MKKIFKWLLYFATISIISAIILEFLIRIFLPVYIPDQDVQWIRHPDGMTLGMPNSTGRQWRNTGEYDCVVHINKYGFRDTNDFKDAKSTDIFIVGDSFTFGHGVEANKRYSNILAKYLNVTVYNLGISGSDINDYGKLVNYAIHSGASIKTLVVGIFTGNDIMLYKNPSSGRKNANGTARLSISFDGVGHRIKSCLANNTALYHAITFNLFAFTEKTCPDLLKPLIKAGVLGDHMRPGSSALVFSQEALISSSNMAEKLARDIPNIVFLLIPDRSCWMGNSEDFLARQKSHETFATILRNKGLAVIDLLPYFQDTGKPLNYYFKYNPHWNKRGHELAAKALYTYFKQK